MMTEANLRSNDRRTQIGIDSHPRSMQCVSTELYLRIFQSVDVCMAAPISVRFILSFSDFPFGKKRQNRGAIHDLCIDGRFDQSHAVNVFPCAKNIR